MGRFSYTHCSDDYRVHRPRSEASLVLPIDRLLGYLFISWQVFSRPTMLFHSATFRFRRQSPESQLLGHLIDIHRLPFHNDQISRSYSFFFSSRSKSQTYVHLSYFIRLGLFPIFRPQGVFHIIYFIRRPLRKISLIFFYRFSYIQYLTGNRNQITRTHRPLPPHQMTGYTTSNTIKFYDYSDFSCCVNDEK